MRLGEGGQGTVYRARRGGRLYAIKFFSLALDDWAWRELEVRLRLRRVGTMRVLGCGLCPLTRPRFVYLVMPYVHGRPLYDWAKKRNTTARDAARMVLEVARQLVSVHAAGVVHRDIKGANVLVSQEDGKPVLVDFGVGTYVGAPEITHPLALPGTRHYRSPEALRFRRERAGEHSPARTSDDLWALGVLLYWLLTGSYPFDTSDPRTDEGTLANVILKEEPEPPHARNPRVPRALSELCLRMLEKSLQARFPNARVVCAELEAMLTEADGTWDVPLCEAWGPDAAPMPQEEGLDLGDWPDKARRLKLYARLHTRRGQPVPLLEEASTPPRAPEAWGSAALALVFMGLLLLLLLHSPASPTPEMSSPAPVASATHRKDGTRLRTPKQIPPRQREQQETGTPRGLTGLLTLKQMNEEGIRSKDITKDVALRPGEAFTAGRAVSYRTTGGEKEAPVTRLAVELKLWNRGALPWTPANAQLVSQGGQWNVQVWPPKPIAPGDSLRILVEVEFSGSAPPGPFLLKLWDADGSRTATLSGVTFP
ncbi:serine/threonine protein kinase [Archangium sp.]|uniref:serine/threonine protein kinase n=1 Tax=Archangium sp. TaxID=1872627 RepID=UPI002D6BED27|nr:DUF2381 family protein [Archangium sp.]HYO59771.1 DUF2381 family protein [Archangium sp.]